VAVISVIWALVWAVMFGVLLLVLGSLLGPSNEPSLTFMMWTIGQVGLVSGALFGVVLAFAENGRAVEQIPLARVALWGALSASVFPVMTGRVNQVFWTCTFGVIVAVAMVASAKRAARSRQGRSPSVLWACALLPVKDAVNPRQGSVA
jgi:hypothetical protein